MSQHPLLALRGKLTDFHNYLFPEDHTISIHHSHANINVLFYIRLVSFLYLTSIYIWAFTLTNSFLNNIIYLTMQGYFFTWLYFLLTLQDYMINGFGKWGQVFPLSSNLKYYIEILFELAFCVEPPITLIFWGFLFKILINMEGITTELIANNANLHAGPMICLAFDMAYNTFSFPKRHFIVVLIVCSQYFLINIVYSLAVHIIYKPINWVTFLSYVLTLASVGMVAGAFFFGNFVFKKFKQPRMADNSGGERGGVGEEGERAGHGRGGPQLQRDHGDSLMLWRRSLHNNFISRRKIHYRAMTFRDTEHQLLGSLLDDEDPPKSISSPPPAHKRVQAFSAPPILFDLGFKIDFDCQDFDSPDPEDLSITEAFSHKQPTKIDDFHSSHQPAFRKMSCDVALLDYYDNPDDTPFDYYQYSSLYSPEQELISNLSLVTQWARDQNGSRTVQNIFEGNDDAKKDAVFHAIFKDSMPLIKDRFGNYVFQKIFEKGLPAHRETLMESLWGSIVLLSMHSYGCRVIQKAIEYIHGRPDEEEMFMKEISICPLELIENQNGNHVIQKCLETFEHHRIKILVGTLMDKLQELSFHAFGCRVIQKYLENHREQEECQLILSRLLEVSIALSQCQYGNYVMQHIVTKCKEERIKVFQHFLQHVVDLSTNKYASNVVEKAIQSPGSTFVNNLADWFVKNDKHLVTLSKHQFGNYVVQSMMLKANADKKAVLRGLLKENATEISKSQYGRHVLLQVEKARHR